MGVSCEILRKIGEGTFGKVYLCQNTRNKEKFVIKKIPWSFNNYTLLSIQREFLVLSNLNHPRLIRYLGFYQSTSSWNFILEFAELGNLGDCITTRKLENYNYFPLKDILSIFIDILAGIKYLHYCCIIHRDLKPDNILLDKYSRAKICDFGISRILSCKTKEDNMSNIGSPFYMAPEVIQGKKYGFKSDIWSLGIILFEMCTLEHPFKLSGPLFDRTINVKLKVKMFHPGLYDLCEKMLKFDTDKRANSNELVNHFLIANKFCNVFFEKY